MPRKNKILAAETLEGGSQTLPNISKPASSNALINSNKTIQSYSTMKSKKNRIIAEEVIEKEILMLGIDKSGKTFFVRQMKGLNFILNAQNLN